MGHKTSVIPQLDFLTSSIVPRSNAPTKLTGARNILVMNCIKQSGNFGCTTDEIAITLNARSSELILSADLGPRLSELHRMNMVRKTEAIRRGKIVWVAV